VTPACQIAVLGDTDEVNSATRDERAAQRWLGGTARPARCYHFTQ